MLRAFIFASATCLCLTAASAATAQSSEQLVQMDFMPGWQMSDAVTMGALRIRLKPGWKTYWRAPGDAGIPPQFSWAGSDNVRAVRIHWPTPDVFDTAGMRTLGYMDEVILPVEIFASDPARPVHVAGEAALGVCRDICIPAQVSFAPSTSTAPAAPAIRAALADQPSRHTGAEVTCSAEPIADGLRLTVQLPLKPLGGTEVAVVELGQPEIWVSEPMTARTGGMLQATAELVPPNAMPFALDRSTVRITVLGTHGAVDVMGCTGK